MEEKEDGSNLDLLAEKIGVPADMQFLDNSLDLNRALIFFGGEALCLLCAVLYHKFLSPGMASSTMRHAAAMSLGIVVGVFSFGLEFGHVIFQATVCYIAMLVLPSNMMHLVVFVLAMSYLVSLHLYRAFMIPEDILYSIDVSGPLMIVTQKITTLAFSVYDGCHGNKDKLSDLQKRYRISKPPSVLEYYSYIFYFQGVLVGPLSFYTDYRDFVNGTDMQIKGEKNGVQNNNNRLSIRPSPYNSVLYKLSIAAFWMIIHFAMKPLYPEMRNADAEFIKVHGFLFRVWYMILSMLFCRAKYYVAFTLGDAICNASGFGFNGYDDKGRAKWNLITNVNVLGIEGATSPKTYIDNWNIQTAVWLRHVCYDRIPVMKRFATFFLSALWHGCYPGYYFTFIFAAPFSYLAGKMRRKIRPHFQGSTSLKLFYDILTWMCTHISISYMVVPFTILHIRPTIVFYNNMYWCLHVLCVVLIFILPYIPLGEESRRQNINKREVTVLHGDISNGEVIGETGGRKEDKTRAVQINGLLQD